MTTEAILWSAAVLALNAATVAGFAQTPHDLTQPIDYRLIFQTDHACRGAPT